MRTEERREGGAPTSHVLDDSLGGGAVVEPHRVTDLRRREGRREGGRVEHLEMREGGRERGRKVPPVLAGNRIPRPRAWRRKRRPLSGAGCTR